MLQDDGKVQFDTSKYLEILKKDLRLVEVKIRLNTLHKICIF